MTSFSKDKGIIFKTVSQLALSLLVLPVAVHQLITLPLIAPPPPFFLNIC